MILRAVGLGLASTTVGAVLALVACSRPAAPSAASLAASKAREANTFRVGTGGASIRGPGFENDDPIEVKTCRTKEPPCAVDVVFHGLNSEAKCVITTKGVVVLGREVETVVWAASSASANYAVWFRGSTSSEKEAFAIRIHDYKDPVTSNNVWEPVIASAPASAASWAYRSYAVSETKASSYDVYLAFQEKGSPGPEKKCNVYDPIIINDGQ